MFFKFFIICFNAIGAAITIKTNDEEFKEQGNLYGVGHMTNYGFGFVFTKDRTFGGSKANTNADNNRNNKNKPKTSHSKSPSNTSGTSKEQGPSEGVPEAFRNLGNAK